MLSLTSGFLETVIAKVLAIKKKKKRETCTCYTKSFYLLGISLGNIFWLNQNFDTMMSVIYKQTHFSPHK